MTWSFAVYCLFAVSMPLCAFVGARVHQRQVCSLGTALVHSVALQDLLPVIYWLLLQVMKINDSPNGMLNSYTLLLMLLYFLIRVGEIQLIPIDVPLDLVPDPEYQPPAVEDTDLERLGQLVIWFFHFYTHEFKWDHDVVSIRAHTMLTRRDKGWLVAPLAVEDPYEIHLNTARNVKQHKSRLIKVPEGC